MHKIYRTHRRTKIKHKIYRYIQLYNKINLTENTPGESSSFIDLYTFFFHTSVSHSSYKTENKDISKPYLVLEIFEYKFSKTNFSKVEFLVKTR